jgi:hypothetical protein
LVAAKPEYLDAAEWLVFVVDYLSGQVLGRYSGYKKKGGQKQQDSHGMTGVNK